MQKQRNVVFIHTPCPELKDDRLEPPLGILYLATFLKKQNIPCQVCDLSGIPQNKWRENIPKGNIYAFSTYSATYHRTLEIKNIVKELSPESFMIAGGPHVSALAQQCAADFDIIIVGEAELKLVEVVRALQEGKKMAGIFKGEPVMKLDELPYVDYDLVDLSSYNRIVDGSRSISLVSSRGCPYNCEFCNSRVFSRGLLRFRSPTTVAKEIQQLKKKYDVTSYRFNDDLFTFSAKRIEEMTEALKPLNIRYRIFARSRSMTPTATKQLYDSGCRHVSIGIESMSERMLRLLKKKTTVKDNRAALINCKKAGLKVRIYLLVGFPGETEASVRESLSVLLNCEFDEFTVYPFIPYPGTSIWSDPESWGAKINRDISKYFQIGGKERGAGFMVTTDGFSPEDVKKWRQLMIDKLEERSVWAGESACNR